MKTLKPRVGTINPARVQPLRNTAPVRNVTVRQYRALGSAEWQRLRQHVLWRDDGVCQCLDCRRLGRVLRAHEVDHVVPVWEGGTDDPSNLQAINRDCHRAKTVAEAARRLQAGAGGERILR